MTAASEARAGWDAASLPPGIDFSGDLTAIDTPSGCLSIAVEGGINCCDWGYQLLCVRLIGWDTLSGTCTIRRPDLPLALPSTPGRGAQLASVHGRSAQPQTREVEQQIEPRTGLNMQARSGSARRSAC